MIDPNRGASEEVLKRLRDESYERLRINLFEAVKKLLDEHEMTWDDLADKLKWYVGGFVGRYMTGDEVRYRMGFGRIRTDELNQIAHCFSAEIYFIFRPRFCIM
jgi:hypothetical protein